jgi:DNA-binding transcriptional MerR regulator
MAIEKEFWTIDDLATHLSDMTKPVMLHPTKIRHWERDLPELRPSETRGGGRKIRYYNADDIALWAEFYELIAIKKHTGKGAIELIRNRRERAKEINRMIKNLTQIKEYLTHFRAFYSPLDTTTE